MSSEPFPTTPPPSPPRRHWVRTGLLVAASGGLAAGAFTLADTVASGSAGAAGSGRGTSAVAASANSSTTPKKPGASAPLHRPGWAGRRGGLGLGGRVDGLLGGAAGPGHMGGLFGGLHGKVTKVGAGSITVSTGAGAARTFKTTSSTKYFTMTTPSTRTDVKVGDEIAVVPAFAKGTPETVHASLAGTVTARAVVVVEPFTTGTVVSVSSDQFVVRNAGGLLRDVVVSASSTKYSEGGTSINGVKKGERIFAYGAAATDPTKLDATNVLVIGPRVVGVVKSISGNVITLTGPGGTTSVTTTSSTTFKKGRTTSSLSAVTKGDVLSAIGTRTNGTFEANAVVFGARPAPRFAAPGSPGPGDSAAGS